MSDSHAFVFVCDEIERSTPFDRLEARGTVRLALKDAGLESKSVTPAQMVVVLTQLMPNELEKRGVADAARLCNSLRSRLETLPTEAVSEAPEAVFARLGGAR